MHPSIFGPFGLPSVSHRARCEYPKSTRMRRLRRNNRTRFSIKSNPTLPETPVILPPDRAKLDTMPASTGPMKIPMIGIVVVAVLKSRMGPLLMAMPMSGLPRTHIKGQVRTVSGTTFRNSAQLGYSFPRRIPSDGVR